MKKLLYGAAYYDEYMPYDRLQQDVAMMKNDEKGRDQYSKDRRVYMEYLRTTGRCL